MKTHTWRKCAISLLMAVAMTLSVFPNVLAEPVYFLEAAQEIHTAFLQDGIPIWELEISPQMVYSLVEASTVDSREFGVLPVVEPGSDVQFGYDNGNLTIRYRDYFWDSIDILLYDIDGDSILAPGGVYTMIVDGWVEGSMEPQGFQMYFPLNDDPWNYGAVTAAPSDTSLAIVFGSDVPYVGGGSDSPGATQPMTDGGHRIRIRTTSTGASTLHNGMVISGVRIYSVDGFQIVPTQPPLGIVGQPFFFQFDVINPLNSVTWTAAAGFPPGLTFCPITATLSGVPTQSGIFQVEMEAWDGTSYAVQLFEFWVVAPPVWGGPAYAMVLDPRPYPQWDMVSHTFRINAEELSEMSVSVDNEVGRLSFWLRGGESASQVGFADFGVVDFEFRAGPGFRVDGETGDDVEYFIDWLNDTAAHYHMGGVENPPTGGWANVPLGFQNVTFSRIAGVGLLSVGESMPTLEGWLDVTVHNMRAYAQYATMCIYLFEGGAGEPLRETNLLYNAHLVVQPEDALPEDISISTVSVVPMVRIGTLPEVLAATTAARVITIHRVDGDNAYLARGARRATPRVGQRLSDGNVITTGRDSFVYLQMDAASVLKIDQSSQVAVSSMRRRRLSLSVESGNALVTAAPQEEGTTLETRVGNVGLTVRGTMFTTGYSADSGITITMLAGAGEVNGVALPAGEAMSVSSDGDASFTAQPIDVNALNYFTLVAIYDNIDALVAAGTFDAAVMDALPGLMEVRAAEIQAARDALDAAIAAEPAAQIAPLPGTAAAQAAARPPVAPDSPDRSGGSGSSDASGGRRPGTGGGGGGGGNGYPIPGYYQYTGELSGVVIQELIIGSILSAEPGTPVTFTVRLVAPQNYEWWVADAGYSFVTNMAFSNIIPVPSSTIINPETGRHELHMTVQTSGRPNTFVGQTTLAQVVINGLTLTNTAQVTGVGNVAIDVHISNPSNPDEWWVSPGLIVAEFQ